MVLTYDPTEGQPFPGIVVDEHQFLAAMPTGLLFSHTVDPRKTERPGATDDPVLRDVALERVDVQRLFQGAKKRNVGPYADYIVKVGSGQQIGVIPPITLWTPQQLRVVELAPGVKALMLPYGLRLVAIDGETQEAARYEAAIRWPPVQSQNVPVVIHHGRDIEWARQAFHDLNALAVKPNAAVAISMDNRDPLTRVARRVEEEVSFFTGRVNMQRRQLGRKDEEVVTLSVLRTACVTFALGIGGVQFGFRSGAALPLTHAAERIERVAVMWFDAVANAIGNELLPGRRAESVLPGPAGMAAVGAFGHSLLDVSDEDVEEQAADRADELTTVDWTRGPRWEGIAGKIAPSGRFSTVGGAKENAYAIYRALTEPESDGFQRIRQPGVAVG